MPVCLELTISVDHLLSRAYPTVMKEVAISEFKAKCLAMVEEVRKTKKPIRVMRRGKPIAEVVPSSKESHKGFIGSMKGTAKILGDTVSPVADLNDFNAWRD
jgi:prevent-host-death family protein